MSTIALEVPLAAAVDVDGIAAGDNHDDSNLASICGWHHRRKSAAEGVAARRARPRPRATRDREQHPGLVGDDR